jgi:hypothetical protein
MGGAAPQTKMGLFPVANEIVYKQLVNLILFLVYQNKLRK